MTDLVDQMFPPVHRKWAAEYTDFNYWRAPMGDFELPDLTPPSPALSARSDTSGQTRLSRLRNFSLVGRRRTLSPPDPSDKRGSHTNGDGEQEPNGLAIPRRGRETLSDDEYARKARNRLSMESMPGSLDDHWRLDEDEDEIADGEPHFVASSVGAGEYGEDDEGDDEDDYGEDDDDVEGDDEGDHQFDDLLVMGEMESVPFL